MTQTKRILVFVLALALCVGLTVPAMAADAGTQYEKTAGYVAKTVASPGFGCQLLLEPILAVDKARDNVGYHIVARGVDHGRGRIDEVADGHEDNQ